MRWAVLPVAGGLYDQHPQLLEEWQVIFREKAAKETRDANERDSKNKNANARSRRGARGRR